MKKYKVQLDKMKECIMPYLSNIKRWTMQFCGDYKEFIHCVILIIAIVVVLLLIDFFPKILVCICLGLIIIIFLMLTIKPIFRVLSWLAFHFGKIISILWDLCKFSCTFIITFFLSYFIGSYLVENLLHIDKLADEEGFLKVFTIILVSTIIHAVISLLVNYALIKKLKEESIIIIECILKVITAVLLATIIGFSVSISKYLIQLDSLGIAPSGALFGVDDIISVIIYFFFSIFTCHSITFEAAKKLNQKIIP